MIEGGRIQPEAPAKNPSLQALRLILPVLASARLTIVAIVLLGLFAALAETAGVGMVLLLLAVMFHEPTTGLTPAQDEGFLDGAVLRLVEMFDGHVGLATVVLGALIVLRIAIVTAHSIVVSHVSAYLAHRTRLRLFTAFMKMPMLDLQHRSWGDLYTAVARHGASVPEVFSTVCSALRDMLVVMVLGAALLLVAPVLAGSAIVALLLLGQIVRLADSAIHRAGQEIVHTTEHMSAILIRALQAMRTFRLYGLAASQIERFSELSRRTAVAEHRADQLANLTDPVSHISALLAVMVMAMVATSIDSGPASLILAVGLLYRLQPYVAALGAYHLELAEALPSLSVVHRLLEEAPVADHGRLPAPDHAAPIRFENVSFRYPGSPNFAIENVTLEIPPRGWTRIDGPSGAGKSTLVNLLLGLFEPHSGTISADGIRIQDMAPEDWRARISVCGQEVELVRGTLRENILLAKPEADAAAFDRAIAAAQLAPLVASLPHGLDTMLGEKGSTLSGGQCQRVGIARALVRRPRLLVLDEATSALDRQSQDAILLALADEMAEGAVLVIGHQIDSLPPLVAVYHVGPAERSLESLTA